MSRFANRGVRWPRCGSALALALGAIVVAAPALAADSDGDFEVHELSIWIVDPMRDTLNPNDLVGRAFPRFVAIERKPPVSPNMDRLTPFALVAFYGDPGKPVDVQVNVPSGTVLGHWPTIGRPQNQLQWKGLSLLSEVKDLARVVYAGKNHWFAQARELAGARYVQVGFRVERFLAYDVEAAGRPQITLDGGPDRYVLLNQTDRQTLTDVVLSKPDPGGRRVGWLDSLPPIGAAPPGPSAIPAEKKSATGTTVDLSTPIAKDSPQAKELADRLVERWRHAGLTEHEARLALSIVQPILFESEELMLLARMQEADVQRLTSLEIAPAPKRRVRVGLLVARNIDPALINTLEALILKLGDPSYKVREDAEEKLTSSGQQAIPHLRRAVGHSDPEIAFRAERILQALRQPIGGR